ncbi:MAG TPA: hypothetical protein VKE51_34140 [Vicinamibacterales bacterium]|nr:hypothetical protein [Vicinamibacterales bacterium]
MANGMHRNDKFPVVPPVYRPQRPMRAVQPVMGGAQQMPKPPVVPAAYRPQRPMRAVQPVVGEAQQMPKPPVVPPVYRPQPAPQPRTVMPSVAARPVQRFAVAAPVMPRGKPMIPAPVSRRFAGVIQRMDVDMKTATPSFDFTALESKINTVKARVLRDLEWQKPKTIVAAAAYLSGKIVVRRGRPIKLSSAGEAIVEYIQENKDEPFTASNPIFKYDPDTETNVVQVAGEVEAIMEYLEGQARTGGGGGLFQHNPQEFWVMNSPQFSPTTETNVHNAWKTQTGWLSPDTRPEHGGVNASTLVSGTSTLTHYATYVTVSPGRAHESRMHMYGVGANPYQAPLSPNFSTAPTTATTFSLKPFVGNFKRAESQEIDLKLLNKWSGQRKGHKPDQNAAMSNTSATNAAIKTFGTKAEGHEWQWLHLIAFTLGGDKSDPKNPNTPENLVSGLAAANGHHLVIENLVKKLILGGLYDKIKINAAAAMVPGITNYHVATHIDYHIMGLPSGEKTYKPVAEYRIDALNPSKSAGHDLKFMSSQITSGTL